MPPTRSRSNAGQPGESLSWASRLNPFDILNPAIKAIPPVKWALGVAGILAALALGVVWFKSPPAALVGAGAMIFLMFLLALFGMAVRPGQDVLKSPAVVLTWAVVVLFIFFGCTTFTCVAFRWPRSFPEMVGDILLTPKTPPTQKPATSDRDITFGNKNIDANDLPPSVKK